MAEPMAAQQIMLAAMASVMIVMFGALYAFVFAWARLRQRPYLMPVAYAFYACLTAAALILARAFHFSDFWFSIVLLMLVGYLLSPHAIWHLCMATNDAENYSENLDSYRLY